ncbi:MAG: NADH-quinone oxidoreductase subunit NuoG [Chloroflexota bacterium]
MTDQVTLTIDDKQIVVSENTLVVDAAKKAGIDVSVFCYHPKLKPAGMCRMCLVEIGRPMRDRSTGELILEAGGSPKVQFGPKLETACTVCVAEGMVVRTNTEKVQRARKDVLEFLLTTHPLDCPVCDKGGECPLQDLTMVYGSGESRFLFSEKTGREKHLPLGDLIYLDRERCIRCGRCVRFQSEIVDDPVIHFTHRGHDLEIFTCSEPGFDSYFSGNTTDICPVGALTTTDFRFGARAWEMRSSASICPHCPVGCNITVNTRREATANGNFVIKRVMPRQNEWVNEIFICDKGRFAYHYVGSRERLTRPLVRKNGKLTPVSWKQALNVVTEKFRRAGAGLHTLVGGHLTNEDLYNLSALTDALGGVKVLCSFMAGGDLVAQVGVGQNTNLAELGRGDAILVVASDLEEEAPLWWLRVKQAAERGATLLVANPRPTKTERYTSHTIRYEYGAEAKTVQSLTGAKNPAARDFAKARNAVVFYGSEGTDLAASENLARACANLLIKTNHIGRPNNGLIGVWSSPNEQGAWDFGFRPISGLAAKLQTASAVYIVGADPVGDNPSLAESLCKSGFFVVQDLFLTETAELADVVLPAQSFAEREGTYTSGERRVQRFYPALPPLGDTKADYTIAALLGRKLDVKLPGDSASQVMLHIAEQVAGYNGLDYLKLAEVVEQWPLMERIKPYYGGTSYENRQGLGVQLVPSAQRGAEIHPHEIVETSGGRGEHKGFLAVPVTRLYDQGRLVMPSLVLRPRIPEPLLLLHPSDATRLSVRDDLEVCVSLNEVTVNLRARIDDTVPLGVVLVPRSQGLPIFEPMYIEIKPKEVITS